LVPTKVVTPKARDFMTRALTTLGAHQTLAEAMDVLMKKKLSGAPVLDAAGKLVGVISELDCMKVVVETSFHQDGKPGMRSIDELMSRDIISVDPDTDAHAIAHLFMTHRIRRVLVVENGALVGLVSRRDVLRAIRALVD
jgi:CBS domain-containing protein